MSSADAVEHVRAAGVEVEVVSPASFRHFGLAFGGGIVQNLRARLWLDEARRLGAREVRVIPTGVAIPKTVGEPADPPHVLFVGRLSEEEGILEFLEATEGLPRVIVGDGPLRNRVPEAVGFVPPDELGAYYERAAVVCVPSRREGYGVLPRGVRSRHGLDVPGAQVEVVEREDGVIELHPHVPVPADQAWFWTARRQQLEREVDEHVERGEVERFDSSEDFLTALDRVESER